MPVLNSLLESQFFLVAEREIPGPPGRNHNPVRDGFPQFGASRAAVLRDREGVAQSGRAARDHGATDPDQPLGPGVQNLPVFELDSFPDTLAGPGSLLHRVLRH